jgi:hypothetical protein
MHQSRVEIALAMKVVEFFAACEGRLKKQAEKERDVAVRF